MLGTLGAARIFGPEGLIERWQPAEDARSSQYALG